MKRAWLALVLAACGPSAAPPASAELEPDPITRPLSEDEVRGEAVRLATRAFDERQSSTRWARRPTRRSTPRS